MIRGWKLPNMIKGALTWLPGLYAWRLRHASTGGTDSPRYCYAVWLRHLVMLHQFGFKIKGAQIGELGPGDSIGAGLAGLLSGADSYVGLDAVPFSAGADLEKVFDALVQQFSRQEPIPDHHDFPRIRPRLDSHEFPHQVVDWTDSINKIERLRGELQRGVNVSQVVTYRAPWTSLEDVKTSSLDLVFSQSVLECVDALEETYRAMFTWLKSGGYSSHVIDFSANYLSPYWNGLWAYRDWEWRLVRGGRTFLFNREPLSTHIAYAKKAGFEVLLQLPDYEDGGLSVHDLSKRFQQLDPEDLRTRGAFVILRKP